MVGITDGAVAEPCPRPRPRPGPRPRPRPCPRPRPRPCPGRRPPRVPLPPCVAVNCWLCPSSPPCLRSAPLHAHNLGSPGNSHWNTRCCVRCHIHLLSHPECRGERSCTEQCSVALACSVGVQHLPLRTCVGWCMVHGCGGGGGGGSGGESFDTARRHARTHARDHALTRARTTVRPSEVVIAAVGVATAVARAVVLCNAPISRLAVAALSAAARAGRSQSLQQRIAFFVPTAAPTSLKRSFMVGDPAAITAVAAARGGSVLVIHAGCPHTGHSQEQSMLSHSKQSGFEVVPDAPEDPAPSILGRWARMSLGAGGLVASGPEHKLPPGKVQAEAVVAWAHLCCGLAVA